MIVFANTVFADTTKMRSQWIRMGPKVNDRCPHQESDVKTQRCREGGWRGAATRQGRPRVASNHWKLEEARKGSPREPPKMGSVDTLIPDSGSRLYESKCLLFQATQFVVLCSGSPGKPKQVCEREEPAL